MNPDFAEALADWGPFFAAVAGIAATLVGLLFVALGLNPRIMGDDGPAGLRVWAGQTFHSFLVLLLIGLAGLVPSSSGDAITITLGIVGVQGIVRIVADVWRVRNDPDPHWRGGHALYRFISPVLAYLTILWMTYGAWKRDPDVLGWFIAVVFLLMISALASCWELLRAVGEQSEGESGT